MDWSERRSTSSWSSNLESWVLVLKEREREGAREMERMGLNSLDKSVGAATLLRAIDDAIVGIVGQECSIDDFLECVCEREIEINFF